MMHFLRYFDALVALIEGLLVIVSVRKGVIRSPERVLVFRIDGIGDFVLWIEAARALRRIYPPGRYTLTLLANKSWIELARQQLDFDEYWPCDREVYLKSSRYRFGIWKKIRSAGCSIVLLPTYSREILLGDAIAWVSGARERIGFDNADLANTTPLLKWFGNWCYTRLVDATPGVKMELIRNAEFVRALGDKDFRATAPRMVASEPTTTGVIPSKKYFVIVPGGGWSSKRWPVDRFFEIAERLNAAIGWEAVIAGGSGDAGLARQFSASATFPVTDLTGRTSVLELVEVIRRAQLVVSNDTGSAHIAAAVGVCCASILGGAHFGRFLPYEVETPDRSTALHAVYHRMSCYGCNWRCVYGVKEGQPVPCVDRVSVDQVWETVNSMMQVASANDPNAC